MMMMMMCSGSLNLADYLPRQHLRSSFEDELYAQHRQLENMTRLEAQLQYIQIVSQLPTFGVYYLPVLVSRNFSLMMVMMTF